MSETRRKAAAASESERHSDRFQGATLLFVSHILGEGVRRLRTTGTVDASGMNRGGLLVSAMELHPRGWGLMVRRSDGASALVPSWCGLTHEHEVDAAGNGGGFDVSGATSRDRLLAAKEALQERRNAKAALEAEAAAATARLAELDRIESLSLPEAVERENLARKHARVTADASGPAQAAVAEAIGELEAAQAEADGVLELALCNELGGFATIRRKHARMRCSDHGARLLFLDSPVLGPAVRGGHFLIPWPHVRAARVAHFAPSPELRPAESCKVLEIRLADEGITFDLQLLRNVNAAKHAATIEIVDRELMRITGRGTTQIIPLRRCEWIRLEGPPPHAANA